jgi:hypothetical protein
MGEEETLAKRYEKNMARLESITCVGYTVEVRWECDYDRGILKDHPKLQTLPIVQQSTLNTTDALYGGQTEAMLLHYKIRDDEPIEYGDHK